MDRLRRWVAIAGVAGGLWGLGLACRDPGETPSAEEREARSELLRNLIASREKPPDPNALQAQRRDLQVETGQGQLAGQGGAGREQPAASMMGTVAWVGDDELLVRDEGGVERELRVQEDTRFRRAEREVSRRTVEQGAEVRISYDVEQDEWVAREVEVLRLPDPPAALQSQPR